MAPEEKDCRVDRAIVETRRTGMDQTERREVVCSISSDMWILWGKWN